MLLAIQRNESLRFSVFFIAVNGQPLLRKFFRQIDFAIIGKTVFPFFECFWYHNYRFFDSLVSILSSSRFSHCPSIGGLRWRMGLASGYKAPFRIMASPVRACCTSSWPLTISRLLSLTCKASSTVGSTDNV